jgi:hypothetical protein
MKKLLYFIICAALLVMNISFTRAQNTEGTEFWLTFGQLANLPQPYFNTNIEIRIVGSDQPTSGRIYFTNLGTFENFSINANEVFTHSLDLAQKNAVYNSTVGVSNRSVYIISYNAPVTVYAFIQHPYVVDEATYVLPVTALGAEYYHISNYTLQKNYKDAYAIVATQNNTHLYHNEEYIATLNAGQVYYNTSSTDMTGAQITSTNPVAYFTVHQLSPVPYSGFSHGCILVEQMAPVNTWGKRFFVPVTLFEKDIVRIVVSQNNTNIEIEGGTLRNDVHGAQTTLNNLKQGDFVELDFTNDYNGCYIQANNPVGVCVYIANTQYTGLHSLPAMSWVPGIEQSIRKALIAPFIPGTYTFLTHHYALVTTPTATRDKTMVSIGGALPVSLNGETWKEHSASGMSFCSVQLTQVNASYVFTNPSGVIIMGYGTGPNNNQVASYFYLAGSAMRDLDAAFYANDIHFQDLKDNPICESLVTFRAEIDGDLHPNPGRIKWYVNEVEDISARDQILWSRNFTTGEYPIRMEVTFANNEVMSKAGALKIVSCNSEAAFYANNIHYQTLNGHTICDVNIFNFRAEVEGLHSAAGSLKWFINGAEEPATQDQLTWNKTFANGNYTVEMWVRYANDTTETLTSAFTVYVGGFIKIKNIRREYAARLMVNMN